MEPSCGSPSGNGPALPPSSIDIDTTNVKHTMAGGAGASWHAIGPTAHWYKDLILGKLNRNCRGSGWGGNPPLGNAEAWNDLRSHARWLGLNFVRVEIDMRMYEPKRGQFDWQNDEMATLYQILDYCQQNNVDVFLTQMWADVEWNAFEGAGRLQSAPKSVEDFAHGMATLMEYLTKTKHYTCIRWLCIVNEPGREFSWWQGSDGKPANLMPALHAVRAELDRRDIGVALSGPDWSSLGQNTPEFDLNDNVVGAFDAHDYTCFPDAQLQELWADSAHQRGIPFFVTEFGDWAGGDPFTTDSSAPSPKSYPNQLVNAEKVIQGLNMGVDGFNRWSFVNRGDLDGQWQLVRTFDTDRWQYLKRVVPEPVPYYSYGILTRFMAKQSTVLQTAVTGSNLVAATLQSPGGDLSLYVLNKSGAPQNVTLRFSNLKRSYVFHKYLVTEASLRRADVRMDPLATLQVSDRECAVTDQLLPLTLATYSTFKLMHDEPGIVSC